MNVKVENGLVQECSHPYRRKAKLLKRAQPEHVWLQAPADKEALETLANVVDMLVMQRVEIPALPTLQGQCPTNSDLRVAVETLNGAVSRRLHR